MAKERLYLYDTTLRDGAQTTGVDFSLADKRAIAKMLDELGLDYIEGGYPGANPLDTEFFANPPQTKARMTAFGMTKRAGRSIANDPGVASLLAAKCGVIAFVAKSWDYQVRVALETTLEDNLEGIAESISAARASGREAILDCEHFFDGYKDNPKYAIECAKTALKAGARWVVLCDTNGGALPYEVENIVRAVTQQIPGENVGIHAHNDTENAVANSLAAICGGARHVQGTLNGLGERCGNANLTSLLPTLVLKPDYVEKFEIGVTPERLKSLTRISHELDELLNRCPNRHAPYVGMSAFATKAGIHASAVLKDPRTYEHVCPESVGNIRKMMVSNQAGKSNIISELERLGMRLERDDPRLEGLLDEIKEKEACGYAYEGADASFLLLAKRLLGQLPHFFDVLRFSVNVERRYNACGEIVSASEAIVKVKVDDETLVSAAEGNGPIHALDQALRKDLGRYQPYIRDVELVDYRVRVFQTGTDAITRVLIDCVDAQGDQWSTVGVSGNVIDASFQALSDSLNYKLLKSGA